MYKFSRYAQDSSGNIQASPTVDVWVAGTGQVTRATIYSTNSGTPLANPFTGTAGGLVEFYLANSRFDVSVNGSVILTDQLAFDTDELSGDITVADNLTVTDNLTVNGTSNVTFTVFNGGDRQDIASAGTVDLDSATSNYVRITGTTTITAITLGNGNYRDVVFQGALTLTNGASLILPGGASILTAAGDTMRVIGESGGVVRVVEYTRASQVGTVVGFAYTQDATDYAGITTTIPLDNTIPQNTEGTEYTQLATTYTPKFSNSLLEVQVNIPYFELGNNNQFIGALFRDSTANAVGAATGYMNSMDPSGTRGSGGYTLRVIVPATATTATTFKFRFGGTTSAGVNLGNYFSTVGVSNMSVREIRQ